MLTAAEFAFFAASAPIDGKRRPRGIYLDTCRRMTAPFTAKDIGDQLGVSRQVAATQLTRLHAEGHIEKVSHSWRGLVVWRVVK